MPKQINEALEVHDTLNPLLFNEDNTLKADVRDQLLLIAEYFLKDHLDFKLPVVDIHLVGSNASFNYSIHSDIDLHVVTNFEMFEGNNPEVIQILFNLEKSSFNSSYEILVKGLEVEIYVEDVKATAVSNGVYSVVRDAWVKFPNKIIADVADTTVDLQKHNAKIDQILMSNNADEIQSIINNLYLMRKNAIDVEGEYGYGNQLFKDIRATGRLDNLKTTYKRLKSNELSLEEFDFGELY